MKKILFTIATLFMVSELFSQTWGIGTGVWWEPANKNAGIQKSLQVGDGDGSDTILISVDQYQATVRVGLLIYDTFVFQANTAAGLFSVFYEAPPDTLVSFATSLSGTNGIWQAGRYRYQYGVWDGATGGAGFPYTELSVYDTLTAADRFHLRIDTSYGITASHDSILWQIDMDDNLYLGVDSALRVVTNGSDAPTVTVGAMDAGLIGVIQFYSRGAQMIGSSDDVGTDALVVGNGSVTMATTQPTGYMQFDFTGVDYSGILITDTNTATIGILNGGTPSSGLFNGYFASDTLYLIDESAVQLESALILLQTLPSDSTGLPSGALYRNGSGAVFRKF